MKDMALFFAALADPTRLRLLHLMHNGEICVCFFQGVLKTNQPKISRHLAYLRNAHIVEARRDGKWMHYRLRKQGKDLQPILDSILDKIAKEPEAKQDLKRLQAIQCCPERYGFSSPFEAEEE